MIELAILIILTIGTYMAAYRVYIYLLITTDLYYWLEKFKSPSRGVYTVNWTVKQLIALFNIDASNRWYTCRVRLYKNIVVSLLCAVGILSLVCVQFTRKTDGTIHTSYLLISSFSSRDSYCNKIDYHIFDTYMLINCSNDYQFSVSKVTQI